MESKNAVKFRVCKASDWQYSAVVEIDSLEDLKNLSILHGYRPVIVDFHLRTHWRSPDPTTQGTITIYDDYMEKIALR